MNIPAGFDPSHPVHLVIFFHGSGVCVRQFLGEATPCGPGFGRPDRFDAVRSNTILVIPQLLFTSRDPLQRTGSLRGLVDELLNDALPHVSDIHLDLERLDGITLVAHSAGHRALERSLADRDLASHVRNVVLFDTDAVGIQTHRRWLADELRHRRLVAIHSGWRPAQDEAADLDAAARRIAGVRVAQVSTAEILAAITTHEVVTARASFGHAWVPWLYFPKVLDALDLPPIRTAVATDAEFATRTPRRATTLALGETAEGELTRDDVRTIDGSAMDTYAITLSEGQRVDISVRGRRNGSIRSIPVDVLAAVFDHEGHEVARDDDSLGDLGSRIAFTADHGGVYTLRVTTFGPAMWGGRYGVSVGLAE